MLRSSSSTCCGDVCSGRWRSDGHWHITLFGSMPSRPRRAGRGPSSAIAARDGVFFAISNDWTDPLGLISDRIGRKISLVLMMAYRASPCCSSSAWALAIPVVRGCTLVGFNFGGNFALFPAATRTFSATGTWRQLRLGVHRLRPGRDCRTADGRHVPGPGTRQGLDAWLPPFIIAASPASSPPSWARC